jgi:hypothetical protein
MQYACSSVVYESCDRAYGHHRAYGTSGTPGTYGTARTPRRSSIYRLHRLGRTYGTRGTRRTHWTGGPNRIVRCHRRNRPARTNRADGANRPCGTHHQHGCSRKRWPVWSCGRYGPVRFDHRTHRTHRSSIVRNRPDGTHWTYRICGTRRNHRYSRTDGPAGRRRNNRPDRTDGWRVFHSWTDRADQRVVLERSESRVLGDRHTDVDVCVYRIDKLSHVPFARVPFDRRSSHRGLCDPKQRSLGDCCECDSVCGI